MLLKYDSFIQKNGRTDRIYASVTSYLVLAENESLPAYLEHSPEEEALEDDHPVPNEPEWVTLYVSGGKRDKINKVDIVGWLIQKGGLDKNEVGMIEIKDFGSYVAVRRNKVKGLIPVIAEEKLKKKKVKVQVAKYEGG